MLALAAVIALLATLAAIGLAGVVRAAGVHVNVSTSMPLGVYQFKAGDFPRHRGDLVFFCPPDAALHYMKEWHPEEATHGDCALHVAPFIKLVAAIPGDTVTLEPDGVHVNGAAAIPGTKPLRITYDSGSRTSWHAVTPHLVQRRWVLGAREVWTYTPQWYSYDSRYFGPIVPLGTARNILTYSEFPRYNPPAWQRTLESKHPKA
jgi:conjugative transfer signal peptidase TraF